MRHRTESCNPEHIQFQGSSRSNFAISPVGNNARHVTRSLSYFNKMTSQSLKVIPCSHQDGKKRKQRREGGSNPPEIAPWRNNLTALSQYHNLYFVAYSENVYVFEPQFPDQVLPLSPVLIIYLSASRPGLRGYIDHRKPQAANHIIIRDLGEEEILLIACDSGDVIGYTTRSIAKVILQQQTIGGPRTIVLPSPFFHENLGASAWGLDVHRRARLLAVSCNTQEITIFAFALAEDGTSADLTDDVCLLHQPHRYMDGVPARNYVRAPLSPIWKRTDRDNWRYHRSQNNFAFSLKGHSANIPNISFLNLGDDEDACPYLTTTDINGAAFLWNLWRRELRPLVSPGMSPTKNISSKRYGLTLLGPRGWATFCLDRRYARLASSRLETYGCEPSFSGDLAQLCDNTDSSKGVPDNSQWHPGFSKFSTVPSVSNAIGVSEDMTMEHENTDEGSDGPFDDETDDDDMSAEYMMFEDHNQLVTNTSSDVATAGDTDNPRPDIAEIAKKGQSSGHFQDYEFCKQLPCNILLTGETDLAFIDHGFPSVKANSTASHYAVACKRPFHQVLPPGLQLLSHIERLNMVHHIPELGVVAIGNQAGRVALLTMTYLPKDDRYGFRIEAILPFKSQEEKNIRPEAPLLGMAISPVQGEGLRAYSPSSGTPDASTRRRVNTSGRYRLLMMYYDNTVLSYEMSRPSAESEVLLF